MASLCIDDTWNNRQICELLVKAGLVKTKFEEQNIDGAAALKLTDADLETQMDIADPKERLKYLNVIRNKKQPKVINDPIHGTINLHPLLIRIIDTPQFQRLRNIKQLGGASFVYPGACHTRFEHSIGIAHLAGEFAETLRQSRKMTKDDKDNLCVQIAGLCRDLGRGPFSNVFDDMFIKIFSQHQTHEEISVKMFDYLVKENGLKPLMKLYDLEEIDLTFIKEMMNPEETYEGRTDDKYFLYEIVSNRTNGIDMVKFDYFARDCHYLGLQNSFDHHRFLKFARVCEASNGKTHICVKEKEVDNVYDIFQTRYRLHKRAYQHRVVKAVELMIKDAFLEAEDLIIAGSNKKLCEATEDMAAFTKLTDHVFEQILHSTDQKLNNAKKILERIISRDLYECLGEAEAEDPTKVSEKIGDYKENLSKRLCKEAKLEKEDFEIVDIIMHNGKKEDLQKNIYFCKNVSTNTLATINKKVSKMLPDYFFETVIRVYYKKTDQMDVKCAMDVFKEWCEDKDLQLLEREELKNGEIDLK